MKTEDLIERIKKKTIKVNVNMNHKQVEFPILYNSLATDSYGKKYKETKDNKESFYSMVLDAIGFRDKEDVKNLKIEDIKTINDDDLRKIGNVILTQSKELYSNFIDNKQKNFFENFHEAILKEYEQHEKREEEYGLKFNSSFSSIKSPFDFSQNSSMKNLISTVNNMKEMVKVNNNYDNIEFPKIKPIKAEDIYTNQLLKQQMEVNENVVKSLEELTEEFRRGNMETTKFNKKNFLFVVLTFIATMLGIVVTILIAYITMHMSSK